jgi:hypothetical protein
MSFTIKNLEKLFFVSKNWPNDAKVGCKSSSDLVKFIEMDEQLKEKLQEFEGEFEQEYILNNFKKFLHLFHVLQVINLVFKFLNFTLNIYKYWIFKNLKTGL